MSGEPRATLFRMVAAAALVAGIVLASVLRLHAGSGKAGDAAAVPARSAVAPVPAAAALAPGADAPPMPGTFTVETVIGSEAVADVRAGETAVVSFVVPRRATVSGVVKDDGRPCSGVVVQHRRVFPPVLCQPACQPWCGPSAETATSGADGRFEQSLPYGGDIALWAVGPDGTRGPEVHISPTAGTRFEVELDLPARGN